MRTFGAWALVAAALIGGYALLFLDTSLPTEFGRYHNLGLMADRQNLLLAACALAVVGAIFAVAGPRASAPAPQFFPYEASLLAGTDRGPVSKHFATYPPVEQQVLAALAQDDPNAVRSLLDAGSIRPRQELSDGRAVLQHAVVLHAIRSIKILRQAGASSRRRDKAGNTAIEMAIGEQRNRASLLAALRDPV